MEISSYTDEILELRPRLWRTFIFMGLTFVIAGLIAFFFLGQTVSLECKRSQHQPPTCIIRQTLFGYTLKEKLVEGLIHARVVESTDSDDDITYRVLLDTDQGNIPLTSYFSSGKQKKIDMVAEINTYLDNKDVSSLKLESSRQNLLLMPLISAGIGIMEILVGFTGRFHTWQFNKVEGTITHKKIGLFGLKVAQYQLDVVSDVQISSSRDSDGDTTYRIVLYTRDGDMIPMTTFYSSSYNKKLQSVEIIRKFLNISKVV